MKKTSLFISILLTAATLSLTACQDEIFNEIRDEIELEDSTISGHINSIVRYQDPTTSTEYIVTENGNVYYKSANILYKTDWTKDTKWSGSASKVAADDTYLYALRTNWEEDVDEGEWVRDSTDILFKSSIDGTWTELHTVEGDTTVALFCTNSYNKGNREAYVRIGTTGVYKLSGSTWNGSSSMTIGTTNASTAPTTSTLSAIKLGSTTYFFNSLAATSNETSTNSTYIYYADGDDIYYFTNGTWNSVDVGSDDIYSMSYTSNYLVLGTDSGLQQSALSSNIPSSANDDFSNASSTLSSYYEVWAVLAVDPSTTIANNAIYAAIDYSGSISSTSAVFDNIGLWAYYSSRAKWNRE